MPPPQRSAPSGQAASAAKGVKKSAKAKTSKASQVPKVSKRPAKSSSTTTSSKKKPASEGSSSDENGDDDDDDDEENMSFTPEELASNANDDDDEDNEDEDDVDEDIVLGTPAARARSGSIAEELTQKLQIEFRFCDTDSDDVGFLTAMLEQGDTGRQIMGDANPSARELSEICCSQRAVGTVVKTAEADDGSAPATTSTTETSAPDDMCAFATVLNLKRYARTATVKELKSRITAAASKTGQADTIKQVFEGGATGWLVRERILNVPDEVAPPLYNCLLEDLDWALGNAASKSKGETEAETDEDDEGPFDFENILIVAPCYPLREEPEAEEEEEARGKDGKKRGPRTTGKKAAKRAKSSGAAFVEYAASEDFVFALHATTSFTWNLPRPAPKTDIDEPPTLATRPWVAQVLILSMAGYRAAVQQLAGMR